MLYSSNHLIDPEDKDNAWAASVFSELYYYGGAECLLEGKDPVEIRKYAAGAQDVAKYKKMFRRVSKSTSEQQPDQPIPGTRLPGLKDLSGVEWQPIGFLPQPLNSARAIIEKTPIYIKCTAIDALAKNQKEKDFEFIQNRPGLDSLLSQFSQMMGVKIEPPQAPNNSTGVDISNFDLDPTKQDELNFYMSLYYKLRPESAFEEVLYALAYALNLKQVRDQEARDQFYYGVSTNQALFSSMTGLPSAKYLYPGNVYSPKSELPDFSDQTFRYINLEVNASELMDAIGAEFEPEELNAIFDANYVLTGKKGKWSTLDDTSREKRTATVPLIYMEFKSWDAINFHKKKNDRIGYMINELVGYNYNLQYSNSHPDQKKRGKEKVASEDEFINKRYIQQTYTGFWLPCFSDYVYKYKKLEGCNREAGKESMSPYSINIHKSQEKSAVELCIPIIDDAQKAAYKMQHCIIMSRPKGMYVDTKYMRQAVQNLVNTDMALTMQDIFQLLNENNVFIGDSEGIDPLELQSGARPYYELPGGVGNEIQGYLLVINDAIQKIAKITGINDALTGQTPNEDALVGLQKLLLQSSINSLHYVQNAMKNQTEKVFRTWSYQVQFILKNKNSKSAKAIESILSSYKIDVIRDLYEIPLHQYGIMVENAPTEEEQARLNDMLLQLYQAGSLTGSDYVTLTRIFNYKDAQQLMAIRESKNRERRSQELQQQQQTLLQQEAIKVQGKQNEVKIKAQTEIQKVITQGEVDKFLAQFGLQADMMLQQQGIIGKVGLQRERIAGQLEKVNRSGQKQQQKPIPIV